MRRGNDRSSGRGPLGHDEIMAHYDRGWSLGGRRLLAERWGLEADADAETLAGHLLDPNTVDARLVGLDEAHRAMLAAVAAEGGRVRGENLRRDLVLKGFTGAGEVLKSLVAQAVLIPTPNPGESDLDFESILEHNTFMQRDLAMPEPMLARVRDEAGSLATAATFVGEVELVERGDLDSLELNLLHLSSLLLHEALRLNKSGTPNRRSLARFARGITIPGSPGEAADELDLKDPLQMDYLSFLLAYGMELGLFRQKDHAVVADEKAAEAFFTSSRERRNRALHDALRSLRYWSELKSTAVSAGRAESEDQLSQLSPTGEPLIGARGYVLSVLKRSKNRDWTPVEAIVELCRQIDASYLARTLDRVGGATDADAYVRAVVERALLWSGVVDAGRAEDGQAMVRFTPRGAALLGMPSDDHGPDPAHGCMVVQPNLEIMVFLDAAPVQVLYRTYQIAERRKLSDRVATFVMTPETVQRGYAHGADADTLIEMLGEFSHAPVSTSIEFQLRDWERVHRRLTIYADGVLLRHRDPDTLDLIVGQLRHDNRDTARFIHLGPSAVFVTQAELKGLERVVERNKALVIDYLGEIPPSLYFVDPLVVMVNPIECDVVTWSELQKIAVEQEDSLGASRFFELDVDLIHKRWPEDPLHGVVDFLEPRCEGGLPAGQYLLLKSQLDAPPTAEVRPRRTLLVLESDELAEIFLRVEEAEGLIDERLGPRVFQIVEGGDAELNELLDDLGIDTD